MLGGYLESLLYEDVTVMMNMTENQISYLGLENYVSAIKLSRHCPLENSYSYIFGRCK